MGRHAPAQIAQRGGFGVPNNTISRHAAAYATNARFVAFLGTFARPAQEIWLPGNDLQDPATWIVPPLCTLKHLHAALLQDYDCTEQPAADLPAPPSGAGGSAAANASAPPPPPLATVQDSPLRMEMNALEQADNATARDLHWKPLSWLGTLRPTTANDA